MDDSASTSPTHQRAVTTQRIAGFLLGLCQIAALSLIVHFTNWWSGLKWMLACIAVGIFSFIPLMGLPGVLAFWLGEIWSRPLLGKSLFSHFEGDRAWPAALFVTFLICVMLLPLAALVSCFLPLGGYLFWNVYFGALAFWASWCPYIILKLERSKLM